MYRICILPLVALLDTDIGILLEIITTELTVCLNSDIPTLRLSVLHTCFCFSNTCRLCANQRKELVYGLSKLKFCVIQSKMYTCLCSCLYNQIIVLTQIIIFIVRKHYKFSIFFGTNYIKCFLSRWELGFNKISEFFAYTTQIDIKKTVT